MVLPLWRAEQAPLSAASKRSCDWSVGQLQAGQQAAAGQLINCINACKSGNFGASRWMHLVQAAQSLIIGISLCREPRLYASIALASPFYKDA